jgi:heat shock protein HspQ
LGRFGAGGDTRRLGGLDIWSIETIYNREKIIPGPWKPKDESSADFRWLPELQNSVRGRDIVEAQQARFTVGQLVHHRLFDYRGVIFDVDPVFMGAEEWYRQVARTRPPKDRPWYHVLVDGATHTTYVAEQNLQPDGSGQPIRHPFLNALFSGFDGDCYRSKHREN